MTSESVVRRVEEACLNGWPSLASVLLDGWLLRFSEGHTRRANSINVIGPSRRDTGGRIEDKLRACAALYAARGLPPIFRLSSAMPQDGLDAALDDAGYGPPEDESRVLLAEALPAPTGSGARLRLTEGAPDDAWLDAYVRISDLDPRAAALHGRILRALALPAVFAAAEAPDGTVASVAFGAVHDGIVCLNSVATAAEHRGRGLGGRAVGAVMAWAKQGGAAAACLPVGAANAPALALYRRLGFTTEVSRYRYRVGPRR